MKNITVLGASNSKNSINKTLATWVANQLEGLDKSLLDLNDFPLPIYSIDIENESGIPSEASRFKDIIQQTDGIILSLAEHNGNLTAAFKNLYDWLSRADRSVWHDKPMLLLATSPGKGGASGALAIAKRGFPYAGGNIVGSFSLPSFNQNFTLSDGISDTKLREDLEEQINLFKSSLT